MLTRAQIQRLAQRHRVGLQVQERDYVQHLLLFLLYGRSQALIFKRPLLPQFVPWEEVAPLEETLHQILAGE